MRSIRGAGPRSIGLTSSLRRTVAVITLVLSVAVVSNVVFGSIGGGAVAQTTVSPRSLRTAGEVRHGTQQLEPVKNSKNNTRDASLLSIAGVPLVDGEIPFRSPQGPFLVVMGIPSTDTSFGRKRRDLQRSSWMTYPGVWRHNRVNSDSSVVAVQYLVGRHPEHNFLFSSSLQQESEEYKDVIPLTLREGRPTTGKRSGGAGYWGLESEVGMSRKALMWYAVAPRMFPETPYVMKCDDDVFVRVPQYVADLQALQHRVDASRLYWGKVMKWGAVKGDPKSVFHFVGGMSVTLSRSLLDVINSFAPIQEHVGDFVDGNPAIYKAHNLDHEDVMVGRIFYETRTNLTVVKDCRFHDVHVGANVKPVTPRSLVVHHVKESEYAELLVRFPATAVETTTWRPSSSRGPFQHSISPC